MESKAAECRMFEVKKNGQGMKPIFEYIDYRKYLKEFYDESKATKRYFSYRFFAQKAGINAPILLKMVIDGKRNLGRKSIEKFIKGLNLKEKEAIYFRNLVLFNQAKSALEKQDHYRVLRSLFHMVPQFLIDDEHFDYFDKWYYSIIREGICHYDYKDNWELIAPCVSPPLTPQQAREAVLWLAGHGLIRKKKNGIYELVQKDITTRSEVKSFVVRNFNRCMIRFAEQALDTFSTKHRYATGITIGLSQEAYDIMVAEIEAFRDRVVQIVDSFDASNGVYQVNIQLFPLMRTPVKKASG
jgi:uncharacterized protein (TIGR02147 family)